MSKSVIHSAAEELLRRAVRAAILDSIVASTKLIHQGELQALEEAVCDALADPELAWALAYLAGVRMAPGLIQEMERAYPPPQLPAAGAVQKLLDT